MGNGPLAGGALAPGQATAETPAGVLRMDQPAHRVAGRRSHRRQGVRSRMDRAGRFPRSRTLHHMTACAMPDCSPASSMARHLLRPRETITLVTQALGRPSTGDFITASRTTTGDVRADPRCRHRLWFLSRTRAFAIVMQRAKLQAPCGAGRKGGLPGPRDVRVRLRARAAATCVMPLRGRGVRARQAVLVG
jgi:hypothetical protein